MMSISIHHPYYRLVRYYPSDPGQNIWKVIAKIPLIRYTICICVPMDCYLATMSLRWRGRDGLTHLCKALA